MTKLLEGLGYVVDIHCNLTSQVKDRTKQLPPAPGLACVGDGGLWHRRDTCVPSVSGSCLQLVARSPCSWSQVADVPSLWWFVGDGYGHEGFCGSQRALHL